MTVFCALTGGAAPVITALQLNAGAIAPETAVLVALLACLLVDLAGEEAASRWVPPICYGGLGTALVLLALQWNAPLEPSFLGSFLADNLAIAFRGVVAASTLLSLLISWRYVERSGTPVGEYAAILLAATLGAMFLCGCHRSGEHLHLAGNPLGLELPALRLHEAGCPLRRSRPQVSAGGLSRRGGVPLRRLAALWPHRW